jgi:hypothetical protein
LCRSYFDANLFSEPCNEFPVGVELKSAVRIIKKHAIAYVRVKRLAGTAVNLRKRADFIGIDGDSSDVETPPSIWLTAMYHVLLRRGC